MQNENLYQVGRIVLSHTSWSEEEVDWATF